MSSSSSSPSQSMMVIISTLMVWCLHHCVVQATVFPIAIIGAGSTSPLASGNIAFNLSFEYVNTNILGPMGHSIVPQFFLDGGTALFRAIDASNYCGTSSSGVWGVLGPPTSASAVNVALVMAASMTPIIAWSATSSDLSDKGTYPSFNRVVPSDDRQAQAWAAICQYNGWTRVGVLATNDAYGSKLSLTFSRSTASRGIRIVYASTFSSSGSSTKPTAATTADITDSLNLMAAAGVRIIAMFMSGTDAGNVLRIAMKLGMADQPYVYLGVDSNLPRLSMPQGAIGTDLYVNQSSPEFLSLRSQILARFPTNTVSQGTAHSYDTVILMGRSIAAMETIRTSCATTGTASVPAPTNACNLVNGTAIQQRTLLTALIKLQTFTGAGGLVQLDTNGDCPGAYSLNNQWRWSNTSYAQNASTYRAVGVISVDLQVTVNTPIVWPGSTLIVPLDRRGVRVGETVTSSPEPSLYVLAYGIAVVGTWVSLILVEQAVALRVRYTTGAVFGWLCLSSFAAAIGVWASTIIGITAIRLPGLPDENNTITFEPLLNFLSILACWPIMLLSFLCVIRGVHSRAAAKLSMNPDNVSQMQSATLPGQAQNKNKSVTSSHDSADENTGLRPNSKNNNFVNGSKSKKVSQWRLFISKITDRWLALGTILCGAAIVVVNQMVYEGVRLPCDIDYNDGVAIAGVIVCLVLCYISLFLLFHLRATQYRSIGAFVFGAAIAAFHFVFSAAAVYSYNGTTPTAQLNGSALQLVGAIVTAVISFILIGLNVTRLKLSRDILDSYLLQTQKKARKLEEQIKSRDDQLEEQAMLINLIHIMRPITRRRHFTLETLVAAAEAHRALYGDKPANVASQVTGGSSPYVGNYSGTMSVGSVGSVASVGSSPLPGSVRDVDIQLAARPGTSAGTPTHAAAATIAATPIKPMSNEPAATMAQVMENPATLEIFKDAVTGNRNGENLAFWIDVQQYKRLQSYDERRAAANDITRVFIGDDAPYGLNISGPLRLATLKKVRESKDAPSRKVFDSAEAECKRLLAANDWPRFINTDAYDACVAILMATAHFKQRKLARDAAQGQEISSNRNDHPMMGLKYSGTDVVISRRDMDSNTTPDSEGVVSTIGSIGSGNGRITTNVTENIPPPSVNSPMSRDGGRDMMSTPTFVGASSPSPIPGTVTITGVGVTTIGGSSSSSGGTNASSTTTAVQPLGTGASPKAASSRAATNRDSPIHRTRGHPMANSGMMATSTSGAS